MDDAIKRPLELPVRHVADTSADESARPAPTVAAWVLRRFPADSVVITTGFGMEGCVLIDLLLRYRDRLTVHYLDTHFLFPETHALRERLLRRYPGLTLVNAGTSLTPEEQAAAYGPEMWKHNPDRCCALRKVEPMRQLLAGRLVWVTAIRRSQSAARAVVRQVDWDWQFDLLKVSPLAHWSREEVYEFAIRYDVPFNELHLQGYPTIGCTHCTRPVEGAGLTDYTRAGRWSGQSKDECGLHARLSSLNGGAS